MQKVIIILLLELLISGCSVKRMGNRVNYGFTKSESDISIYESLAGTNLSNKGFFINKAEIEYISDEGKEKLIGTIKFKLPDEYLISLRSKTGIEAARIFINSDTLLINDRINRKLLCGSAQYLKRKYGLTISAIHVIFGDFICNNTSNMGSEVCEKGKVNIDCTIDNILFRYLIDCNKGKIISAIGVNNISESIVNIEYKNFYKTGTKLVPGSIEIKDGKSKTEINIFIRKLIHPWDGIIEFVPGNRYEIIDLI